MTCERNDGQKPTEAELLALVPGRALGDDLLHQDEPYGAAQAAHGKEHHTLMDCSSPLSKHGHDTEEATLGRSPPLR